MLCERLCLVATNARQDYNALHDMVKEILFRVPRLMVTKENRISGIEHRV